MARHDSFEFKRLDVGSGQRIQAECYRDCECVAVEPKGLGSSAKCADDPSYIGRLGLLGRAEKNLTDEALRRLRHDGFDSVGDVFGLKHLGGVFLAVR